LTGVVAEGGVSGGAPDVGARRVTQQVQFLTRPDGARLYTALTTPTAGVDPSVVVLFCPPAFDEHSRAYPVMREYARALAARGIVTLRFDYFATGDSAGLSDEFTMSSAVKDVSFLLSWLAERYPTARIVPMGVRLGARLLLDALAGLSGDVTARVTSPILWDPVLDVRNYVFAELRATLSGAMIVYQGQVASREDIVKETLETGFCERRGYKLNQIDGYPVTRELLTEVGLATAEAPAWSYPNPVSVLLSVRAASAAERPRAQLGAMLPQMDFHAVEEMPYWNQQPLYRQTRDKLFAAADECLARCRS